MLTCHLQLHWLVVLMLTVCGTEQPALVRGQGALVALGFGCLGVLAWLLKITDSQELVLLLP